MARFYVMDNPQHPADWDECPSVAGLLVNYFSRFFPVLTTARDRKIAVAKVQRMLDGDLPQGIQPLAPDEVWETITEMAVARDFAMRHEAWSFEVKGVGYIPFCAKRLRLKKDLARRVATGGKNLPLLTDLPEIRPDLPGREGFLPVFL